MQLVNEDLVEAVKVAEMFSRCPRAETCFLNDEKEGIQDCGFYIVKEGREEIQEECPIIRIKETLPHCFLTIWRNFAREVPFSSKFVKFSLEGIAPLYNNVRKSGFAISEELIERQIKEEKEDPRGFYLKAIHELKALHPQWFKALYARAHGYRADQDTSWFNWTSTLLAGIQKRQVDQFSWEKIVLLLKIFIEGTKPIQPSNEDLSDKIKQYLQSQKKDKK